MCLRRSGDVPVGVHAPSSAAVKVGKANMCRINSFTTAPDPSQFSSAYFTFPHFPAGERGKRKKEGEMGIASAAAALLHLGANFTRNYKKEKESGSLLLFSEKERRCLFWERGKIFLLLRAASALKINVPFFFFFFPLTSSRPPLSTAAVVLVQLQRGKRSRKRGRCDGCKKIKRHLFLSYDRRREGENKFKGGTFPKIFELAFFLLFP